MAMIRWLFSDRLANTWQLQCNWRTWRPIAELEIITWIFGERIAKRSPNSPQFVANCSPNSSINCQIFPNVRQLQVFVNNVANSGDQMTYLWPTRRTIYTTWWIVGQLLGFWVKMSGSPNSRGNFEPSQTTSAEKIWRKGRKCGKTFVENLVNFTNLAFTNGAKSR